MKVAILGAGIVGVTTAYQLMQDGHDVILVDRQPGIALECSYANGGFIAISQSIPWSAPGALARILATMARPDAPILLRPSQLPKMWRWGLEFVANTRPAVCWQNTKNVLRLALYSHEILKHVRDQSRLQYSYRTGGCLKLYADHESLEDAVREQEPQIPLGLKFEVLTAAQCLEKVPALAVTRHALAGGIYVPYEEGGDCYEFAKALAERIEEDGATLRLSSSIQSIDLDKNRVTRVMTSTGPVLADHYVLAAGADAPRIMQSLGVRLPIIPVKGYSMTVPRHPWPEAPEVQIVDEKHLFGLNPLGIDRLRLAGLAEITGYDTTPEPRRTRAFFAGFLKRFPQLAACLDQTDREPFCCLRPVTPSGLPILGRSRFENLSYNIGHGHLGWTLAHGTARILADLVAAKTPEIDVSSFGPRAA